MPEEPSTTQLTPAAQYLRMSTEHQQYSIANQSAAIALYAAAHKIGIVRSFTDEGKSGTKIQGRSGLQELLRTVESGSATFKTILVYDVSRWGRFSDADEAAHYEFLCKKSGISVQYCAEQFENDNSTISNLLKALKRTMAGEYSRELSVKVYAGQCNIVSKGFWMGGAAPFGMVRQLVDKNGKRRRILKAGERKSIQTDHVVLRPGDHKEVELVRLIFSLFTDRRMNLRNIQKYLNNRRLLQRGRLWNGYGLDRVLTNSAYKGSAVFGRWKSAEKKWRPPEQWVVFDRAWPGIISPEQFEIAQQLTAKRKKGLVNSEMLEALQRLWKRKGTLNTRLIRGAKGVPSTDTYRQHFGRLSKAYDLIGFPHRDHTQGKHRKVAAAMRDNLSDEICYRIRATGGKAQYDSDHGILINGYVTADVHISMALAKRKTAVVWQLPIVWQRKTDLLIVARVEPQGDSILDYYVVPRMAGIDQQFYMARPEAAPCLHIHRVENLSSIIAALKCRKIPGVA